MGCTLALDTLKYTSVDSDIRATIDYLVFKAQGVQGLPKDLYWIYKFIDPNRLRRLKPNQFVIMTRSGCLGIGVFPDLSWHKREREHILKVLGIEVKYGEEIKYSQDRGSFSTLGDHQHSEIIELYIQGLSMNKIGDQLGISSATPHRHIKRHNREVQESGECSSCRNIGSEYLDNLAKRK